MSIAELERLSPPDLGLPPATARRRPEVVRDARLEEEGAACLILARRPCDDARFPPARRDPAALADASATAWLLAEASSTLDPERRRSILDGRLSHHGDHLHPLVADESCDVRIGGAPVTGALRAALLAWLPPSRTELGVIEQGLFRDAAAEALTLLVRPPTVWSLREAVAAARCVPGGPRFEPERFDLLELHGRGRVRPGHLRRLRSAVARIERQLPVTGFPVASATIGDGCRVIASDDVWCGAIAARELARFAISAFARRAAR